MAKYGDNGGCELCGKHDDNKGFLVNSTLASVIRVSTLCKKCAKESKFEYKELAVINDPNHWTNNMGRKK